MRSLLTTLCTLLCLSLAPQVGAAQELGWSYTISTGVEREPTYVGSKSSTTELSFGAEARYTVSPRLQWVIALGGVGVNYRPTETSTFAVSLEYEPGRDNGDDPILAGFSEMENTWELQAMYFRDFGAVDIGLGFQQDILGKGKGLVGFVGAQYDKELSDRLSFKTALVLSFADAEHMNTEVGISASEAALSGLGAYSTSGGFKSTTLNVGLDYQMTDRTALYADASFERYGSKIADSPLVGLVGKETTTAIELGLRYEF